MQKISSFIAPKKTISTFVGRKNLAENVWLVSLAVSEPMVFKPGQYVSLKVTDQGMRRSYSVASFEKGVVGLIVGVVPNGVGSTYLKNLQEGDFVELMGFFGDFVVRKDDIGDKKKAFFVATGVGIAPFGPMIGNLLGSGFAGEVVLIWGLRHIRGIYWREYLNRVKEKYSNFSYQIYLSQPESEWSGLVGHVGDYLDDNEKLEGVWYLCGSNEMITEMKERLVAKGVSEDDINYEKFY
mgnify:FL=1